MTRDSMIYDDVEWETDYIIYCYNNYNGTFYGKVYYDKGVSIRANIYRRGDETREIHAQWKSTTEHFKVEDVKQWVEDLIKVMEY